GQADARVVAVDEAGAPLLELIGADLPAGAGLGPTTAHVSRWMYHVDWIARPVETDATVRSQVKAGRWLVVGDGGGLAAGVAALVERRGQAAVLTARPDADALARLLTDAAAGGVPWR